MDTIATPQSTLDRDLSELREGARRWAALDPGAKAQLLERVRDDVSAAAPAWATAAATAKGIAGTPYEGEEWLAGPWAVLYALNGYVMTLREVAAFGAPRIPGRQVHARADGRIVARVFPNSFYDRLLFRDVRAEVWMDATLTRETLPDTLGTWYRESPHLPRVSLVLGAGNISSIAPLDILYKLVADGAVCMLKLNPVNAYLGPIFARAFKALIDEGYLRQASGDAQIGEYLCRHSDVDDIHITGSAATHDAIVFGTGPDREERKNRNDPLLRKPISSELGNVSPTIVVPGPWSDADIAFHAENIVTQKMHNGGFNCIAAQVLIVPQDWEATPRLFSTIEGVMAKLADRPAYYPGAAHRIDHISGGRTQRQAFGRSDTGFTPRTLLRVDSSNARDTAFRDEAFSSVLAVTALAGDVETYLAAAVAFANDTLWGTLGANIIAHPQTLRRHAAAVDRALDSLRYGCIGVNAWTGVAYFIAEATWGAFPGHTADNIGSGMGVVHNAHLFSRAQKSVVYAPFAPFPKPPWFVTNKASVAIGRALCRFEAARSPLRLVPVLMAALRG